MDINDLLEQSKRKNVLIFKHSPRCGTSRFALRNFEKDYAPSTDLDTLFVDVLESRMLSNSIADKLCVHHESPQAILLKNGKVIYHASHNDIDAEEVIKLTLMN